MRVEDQLKINLACAGNVKFKHCHIKMLSASGGGFAPWPRNHGLCPWTPLGALPPKLHYRLTLDALAISPPKFQTLVPPMFATNFQIKSWSWDEQTTQSETQTMSCLRWTRLHNVFGMGHQCSSFVSIELFTRLARTNLSHTVQYHPCNHRLKSLG